MLHALYLDCLCAVCKNLCEYSLYSTSSINDLRSSIYSPVIRRQLRILQKEWVQEWLNSYARRLVIWSFIMQGYWMICLFKQVYVQWICCNIRTWLFQHMILDCSTKNSHYCNQICIFEVFEASYVLSKLHKLMSVNLVIVFPWFG